MEERLRRGSVLSQTFEYIFFDWDGCLADTLGIWMELYKLALSRRGIPVEEQAIGRELFNDWSGPGRFGVPDVEAFALEIMEGLDRRIPAVKLNPWARTALKRLRLRGKRTAILTGSRRSFVEPVVAREGIASLIDLLVCLEDVQRLKPHPEAVNRALEILGPLGSHREETRRRQRAVMVGDSSKDIEMGRNAGIATILYFPDRNRRFYEPQWLLRCGPDYTIRDFRELEALLA
ncbi:MAG: HAD family hydrolase [Spirochaetales bacterium]|nr:HAD family hydrolase [Spirochaetales bacterium]